MGERLRDAACSDPFSTTTQKGREESPTRGERSPTQGDASIPSPLHTAPAPTRLDASEDAAHGNS